MPWIQDAPRSIMPLSVPKGMECTRPPILSLASSILTVIPALCKKDAAPKPAAPAPMTITLSVLSS